MDTILLDDNIKDSRLQHFLKQKIAKSEADKALLRNVYLCCERVLPTSRWGQNVFVLTDGHKSRFSNVAYCHNPWICPVCSANVMARHATQVACAIEALQQYYNQVPIMVTYTVPHVKWFTCQDTTDILVQTSIKLADRLNNAHSKQAYASFRSNLNVKYMIKVMEHTWCSENGWHPHYHVLYFIDKDKLDLAGDYEKPMLDMWQRLIELHAVKILRKNHPDWPESKFESARQLFLRSKLANEHRIKSEMTKDGKNKKLHQGVFFSRDKKGKVISIKASHYICGWGGDNELTGQHHKEAYKSEFGDDLNHYTPNEILRVAYKFWQDENYAASERWLDLYMEYARSTRIPTRRHRIKYSQGLKAIIEKWKKTNEYIEFIKKKVIDKQSTERKWTVVYWFTKEQWFAISSLERDCHVSIKSKILELALSDGGQYLKLKQLIEQYDTKLAESIFYDQHTRFFENPRYMQYILFACEEARKTMSGSWIDLEAIGETA